MYRITAETDDSTIAKLLKLAAKNDIEGFTKLIDHDPTNVDQVGQWYVLRKGSTQAVRESRTPLMVASMYGSLDVLKKILSLSRFDVNRSIGVDQTTALHCAASAGSLNAVDAVKLLLAKGADRNMIDANRLRPVDMINDSPKLPESQNALHDLLRPNDVLRIKSARNYTDEFMMYSFKVMQCSLSRSHNLEQCPFTHLGEDVRRRDPRIYRYSCVPCSEFKRGTCRKGDLCEYAHGVLERWLHPTQYRTRLCKYGTSCDRDLCSNAHKQEELRYEGSSTLKPSLAPSGNRMFNWQQPNVPTLFSPGIKFQSGHFSDQSMFSPRKNMSNFNQFQLMSPQSSKGILPVSARGLNLAPDYQQHQHPHVRSLSSQELGSQRGSTSLEPSWVVKNEELDTLSSLSLRSNLSVSNQLQQQQEMLFPFNMNSVSAKNTHFGVQSMFAGSIGAISPISGTRIQHVDLENRHQQELRSLSSRELGSNSVDSWSVWGSSSGKPDWAVNREEPNFSFFQSPLKETPQLVEGAVYNRHGSNSNNELEHLGQSTFSAWAERMQPDRGVAQQDGTGWQYIASDMGRNEETEKKSNS